MTRRWDPYILHNGSSLLEHWTARLNDPKAKILYIVGRGFDPRMCIGPAKLLGINGKASVKILRLDFDEGPNSPTTRHQEAVDKNNNLLAKAANGRATIETQTIPIWAGTGPGRRRIGGLQASNVFPDAAALNGYSDIFVDVSAIPRSIYFPLLGKLLALVDSRDSSRPVINLHAVVCEQPLVDERIRHAASDDDATYIYGFGSTVQADATESLPKVWIPLLGEGQLDKLRKIFDHVKPAEICPVIPSPSRSPRRGDTILLEYRGLLLDEWRVEPGNLLHAAETNPFEAYRQVSETAHHYLDTLKPLQGCKIVLSALSSKLLSLGALLAAYELRRDDRPAGVCHVDSQGYEYDETQPPPTLGPDDLYSLWLTGEPYEA